MRSPAALSPNRIKRPRNTGGPHPDNRVCIWLLPVPPIFGGSMQLSCWKMEEANHPKVNKVSQTEVAQLDDNIYHHMFVGQAGMIPGIPLQAMGLAA